jgi:tRNA pseudouridine55 synthase
MRGIAVFYKEKGQTSYDVIRDLKKRLDVKKNGHGGTLDPLAEGVLIIGIGKEGTKQLTKFLKGQEKEYIAEIVLGAVSDTFDAEGKLLSRPGLGKWPSEKAILDTLKQFEGEFLQTPPPFSAVKISGQPAYKLARAGKEVKIEPKKVFIYKIELLDYQKVAGVGPPLAPILKLKLLVQSGFYVRSFANDLGKILKTGAYLKELTRTRVGDFKIEEAITIQDLNSDFLELYFKAQGRVQGVFFRDTSQRLAKRLGLTGKAENLPNGKEIEIIAQGKEKNLQIFLEKIKNGPIFARIDSSSHYFRKPQTKYHNFAIY